jgi:hypothetical protein
MTVDLKKVKKKEIKTHDNDGYLICHIHGREYMKLIGKDKWGILYGCSLCLYRYYKKNKKD